MKQIINVITRVRNNQNGGYTIYVYNNEEEMLADHPLAKDGKLDDETKAIIMNGEDEYGYIDEDCIEVEMIDGEICLSSPLKLYAGQ